MIRPTFVSSDESVSVQAGFSATNDLTDNTAILLKDRVRRNCR